MESTSNLRFSFSIDRGGTFTDIYCEIQDKGKHQIQSRVMKLLSVDPANYKDAPTEGIRRLLSEGLGIEIPRAQKIPTEHIESIRMGTTVATNALLERKGDRVALLINKGLRDVLEIGNQSRPKIFDLEIRRPEPIYEEVVEVSERIRPLKGDFEKEADFPNLITGVNQEKYVIDTPLDGEQVRRELTRLRTHFDSLAVVLMHSYACPQSELAIGVIAKELGFSQISLSHQIMQRVKLVKRG